MVIFKHAVIVLKQPASILTASVTPTIKLLGARQLSAPYIQRCFVLTAANALQPASCSPSFAQAHPTN